MLLVLNPWLVILNCNANLTSQERFQRHLNILWYSVHHSWVMNQNSTYECWHCDCDLWPFNSRSPVSDRCLDSAIIMSTKFEKYATISYGAFLIWALCGFMTFDLITGPMVTHVTRNLRIDLAFSIEHFVLELRGHGTETNRVKQIEAQNYLHDVATRRAQLLVSNSKQIFTQLIQIQIIVCLYKRAWMTPVRPLSLEQLQGRN